jgi:pimeloyl-ACP methyl ester carboxylesterase
MGSSLGGTFALYAAMRDERLKAVLCHDVMDIAHDLHVPVRFPRVVRFMIRRLRWLATLMPWLPVPLRVLVDWNHVVERRSLLASLVADRHMVWTYPLRTWSSFLEYAPSTTFANISTPMKIIVGDRDLLFPPDHCRWIAEKIGRNGASFEVLNGGHALPLESIPQTIAVAQRWFGEHLRTGAWDGSIRAEGSTC